ncbi:M56 family metallopeptidase [Agathobaculum sp.]|uniref:M56 family metallopeptidase n=1 Tax=Agathobaculum sp. TaxID=2048138 RepID=UPI0027B99695|nr:M56 family metallopeptidase [Agathobaculum sp.]
MFPVSWSGLINNVVQIGLTVSAAALVLFLLRRVMKKRYPARAICFVWALLAIRLLIPVQLTLPDAPVQVTPIRAVTVDMSPREEMQSTAQAAAADETRTPRVSVYRGNEMWHEVPVGWNFPVAKMMFILWGAGILAFLGWQAYSYIGFVYLARETGQAAERDTLRRVFEDQKQSLGIRRDIPLVVTPAADCPMLAGFLRPALYLPDEALSEQEAMFVFRHELTHLKRGDLWLKLLLTAARAVHWFNPLVYLMARFAQEDIELACDDAVVRGMDGAARRAYGETILKSATAQVKKRALVSCFTGDKKTLMRRFEGLFDTRAKKRGVALVVAAAILVGSLGCAVSVGESKDSDETFEARALEVANVWAQSYVDEDYEAHQRYLSPQNETYSAESFSTGGADYQRYVVEYEPEDQTCLIVYEYVWDEARVQEWGIQSVQTNIPYREAQRLYFIEENGTLLIDEAIWVASSDESDLDGAVTSLEEFRILYENDLGLPDYTPYVDGENPQLSSDPAERAVQILHLGGGSAEVVRSRDVTNDGENDLDEVQYTFATGEQLGIIMAAGQPQDYTYGDGENNRTAADLAQQYARAVSYESVWPLYPVLSGEEQQGLVRQTLYLAGYSEEEMENENAVWYSKYGASSPSFRNYVIVPGKDENTCIAVFQMYGGGVTDGRTAANITVGKENGRVAITGLAQFEYDGGLGYILTEIGGESISQTQSELFRLLYGSGLPWPDMGYGNSGEIVTDSYNSEPIENLEQPLTAAEAVFSFFHETYEYTEGDTHYVRSRPLFTAALVQEDDAGAVVRLSFTDGSPSVDVQMQKTGDYWLPVGFSGQFDDGFGAYLVEDDSLVSYAELPVGATVAQAIENANGEIPLVQAGQVIKLEPAWGKILPVDGTLSDAVVRADGTLQYTEKETQKSSIRFEVLQERRSAVYLYTAEHIPAEYLNSASPDYIYRGVTVTYRSAHITGIEQEYTAAFVYRLATGSAASQPDYTITSTTYHNDTYGYTLTLPECFVDRGYLQEMEENVRFGMKNASPSEFTDPFVGGTVMTLCIEATAYLQDSFGEDWVRGHPVPCVELAEHNGLTYYLAFASDVQYDPADAEITAQYGEMRQAAESMGGSAISFDGQTNAQHENEQELLLRDLSYSYAYRQSSTGEGPYTDQITVVPDVADHSALVTIRFTNWQGDYYFTTVERVRYDRTDTVTPSHTETLLNTSDGVRSLEQFILAFPLEQELPYFEGQGLESLSDMASRPASQDNPDLSTPQACAAYALHLVAGEWAGADDTQPEETTWCTYQWEDGFVQITLQRVQLTDDSPVLWLPIGWRTEESGIGFVGQWPHYYSVLAHMPDYYSARDTDDLLWYLDMGWADGAYAEAVWDEIDRRWRLNPEEVESAIDNYSGWSDGAAMREMWQQHRDSLEPRFSDSEIETAYQAVRDYAAANGFSVENLRYDPASERAWSESIMENGVLQDNVQQDGLTIDDVITVVGDAQFGEDAWRESAEGWSFALYRGTDGRWVLEDGAFGY